MNFDWHQIAQGISPSNRLCGIADITPQNGIKWMGTVACCVSVLGISTIYFPMWGGMFLPAKAGYTEEDYYFAEYTAAEREEGLHLASSKFVSPFSPSPFPLV